MNLEQVEKLFYEIELERDNLEIEEEKIETQNSDYQVWAKFYNDLNKSNANKKIEINSINTALEKIEHKEKLLDGKLTRKDTEIKKELSEKKAKLEAEINENLNNMKDVSKTCKELLNSNINLEASKNIKNINKKINDKENAIKDIYNECYEYINNLDKKIENKINDIKEAAINNDNNLIISYSIELTSLQEVKNKEYYNYQKIVEYIKNNGFDAEVKEVKEATDEIDNDFSKANGNNSNTLEKDNEKNDEEEINSNIEPLETEVINTDEPIKNDEDIEDISEEQADNQEDEEEIDKDTEVLTGDVIGTPESIKDDENEDKDIIEEDIEHDHDEKPTIPNDEKSKNCAVQIESNDKDVQLKTYNHLKNKVNEIINDSSTKENDLEFAKKREMATDSVLKEYREFHDNKLKEENQELEKNIIKTTENLIGKEIPVDVNDVYQDYNKIDAIKEIFNDGKEVAQKAAVKIKNVIKLGKEKSSDIMNNIKNSKIVAGAIDKLSNNQEFGKGRI